MKSNIALLLFTLFYAALFGQSSEKVSYLALGDSYTIGESVNEAERWPNILVDSLIARDFAAEPAIIIAKTGWRTDELIDTLKKRPDLKQFDLVSLLIGVNNQFQGKDIAVFKKEFKALIEIAKSHSKKGAEGVFVLSIPDYGVTPFAANRNPAQISREIELYNTISREICEQKDVLYIDITPISKAAKMNARLLAADGLHPSGLMYQRWVTLILKNLDTVKLKATK